jgi:tetratricopeptide (TPR) repeat protein
VTRHVATVARAATCGVLALLLPACSPSTGLSSSVPTLREVTLPDLTRMDHSVQRQIADQYAVLQTTLASREASAADRALAFGRLGMLLQAGEYYEAAEPAYLNAQDLSPQDIRWPYYLAHLHKSRGRTDESVAALHRVLALQPNDVPALIWLARAYMDQGKADMAEPLFERARGLAPTVAVLAGLGQAALARRDYARAVAVLEEALSIDPAAASVRSPLAQAYRGLGKTDEAEAHLKQWRNTDILVPDPLRMELDLLLESGLSYELRGVRALEQRDFKAAAGLFERGVAITSGEDSLGRSLRHKLGTALYLNGDLPGAMKWFEETVRLAPPDGLDETAAKAHYSLGVLMASSGRGEDAIRHLSAAVRFSPNYVEAYQALADAQRRAGRVPQSMESYREALRINPQAADARFGYGMALVRLGRHRQAFDWFTEARTLHPQRIEFAHALARLLAASPDDTVRDGERAQAIVEGLLEQGRSLDLGETLAMALAERGRFDDAIGVQREVMEASRRAGFVTEATRMAANLTRYERSQPSRTPWADDDPIHSPGPAVDPALEAALSR